MKHKLRNIFLLVGLVALAVMLCTLDMSWSEVWRHVRQAGVWLPASIALWLPIYMMNTCAWQAILNDGESRSVGFWLMLKYTISGYALNYVTPVGLLGGEPYRIMELSTHVETTRATGSVILYSMTHIFSHFCFWSFGLFLFLFLHSASLSASAVCLMLVIALFCATGIWFFMQGYRHGLALRTLRILAHLPVAGGRIHTFAERHADAIRRVDTQIAALHKQHRRTFFLSLSLEFLARMLGCVEVMFLLLVFTRNVSYWDCVLFQAFSSLFANLLFFIPMQMGTREGGLAIIASILRYGETYGVLVSLLTRLRELVWIAVGLLLIKVAPKNEDG